MAVTPYLVRPTLTEKTEIGQRDGSSVRFDNSVTGPGGMNLTRRIKTLWSESDRVPMYFLGDNQVIWYDDGAKTAIKDIDRLTPLPHPTYTNLYASSVAFVGGMQTTSHITPPADLVSASVYTWAVWDINYNPLPYKVLANNPPTNEMLRYTEIGEPRVSADYVTTPSGSMVFRSQSATSPPEGLPCGTNPGKVIPIMEVPMSIHRVPYAVYDPFLANPLTWAKQFLGDLDAMTPVESIIGKVNLAQIYGYKPGTLLLLDWKPVRTYGLFGKWEYRIDLTFGFKPTRWNYVYYFPPGGVITNAGFYLLVRGPTWYADNAIPDNVSIYNITDLSTCWDFRDPDPGL